MDPADRIARLTGASVTDLRVTGNQHLWRHYRGLLADGRQNLCKIVRTVHRQPIPLRGRGSPMAVRRPCGLRPRRPSRRRPCPGPDLGPGNRANQSSGRPIRHRPGPSPPVRRRHLWCPLARLHSQPPPRQRASDLLARVVRRRLEPYLRQAADSNALTSNDVALVDQVIAKIDQLAGPPGAPGKNPRRPLVRQPNLDLRPPPPGRPPHTAATARATSRCSPCSAPLT